MRNIMRRAWEIYRTLEGESRESSETPEEIIEKLQAQGLRRGRYEYD